MSKTLLDYLSEIDLDKSGNSNGTQNISDSSVSSASPPQKTLLDYLNERDIDKKPIQPIGLVESLQKRDWSETVPFIGGIIGKTNRINQLKDALKRGGIETPSKDNQGAWALPGYGVRQRLSSLTDKEKAQYQKEIEDYAIQAKEIEDRGYTLPAMVVNTIIDAVPFMAEMYSTGGMRTALTKAGEKAISHYASKVAGGQLAKAATKVGGIATGAIGNLPAMAHRMIPAQEYYASQGDGQATAALKAFGDTYIEALSESTGPGIRYVASRIPGMERVVSALGKYWPKASGSITKRLEEVGFHGVLEEMGEERVGDALRSLTGIQSFSEAIPSLQQLLVEAISFSVPSLGAGVYSKYKEYTPSVTSPSTPAPQQPAMAQTPAQKSTVPQTPSLQAPSQSATQTPPVEEIPNLAMMDVKELRALLDIEKDPQREQQIFEEIQRKFKEENAKSSSTPASTIQKPKETMPVAPIAAVPEMNKGIIPPEEIAYIAPTDTGFQVIKNGESVNGIEYQTEEEAKAFLDKYYEQGENLNAKVQESPQPGIATTNAETQEKLQEEKVKPLSFQEQYNAKIKVQEENARKRDEENRKEIIKASGQEGAIGNIAQETGGIGGGSERSLRLRDEAQVGMETQAKEKINDEDYVKSLVAEQPKHIDEIIRSSGLPTSRVSSILSMLEMKGDVIRGINGNYFLPTPPGETQKGKAKTVQPLKASTSKRTKKESREPVEKWTARQWLQRRLNRRPLFIGRDIHDPEFNDAIAFIRRMSSVLKKDHYTVDANSVAQAIGLNISFGGRKGRAVPSKYVTTKPKGEYTTMRELFMDFMKDYATGFPEFDTAYGATGNTIDIYEQKFLDIIASSIDADKPMEDRLNLLSSIEKVENDYEKYLKKQEELFNENPEYVKDESLRRLLEQEKENSDSENPVSEIKEEIKSEAERNGVEFIDEEINEIFDENEELSDTALDWNFSAESESKETSPKEKSGIYIKETGDGFVVMHNGRQVAPDYKGDVYNSTAEAERALSDYKKLWEKEEGQGELFNTSASGQEDLFSSKDIYKPERIPKKEVPIISATGEAKSTIDPATEIQSITDSIDTETTSHHTNKVFIHHVFYEYKKSHPEITREEFNQLLWRLHREHKIELGRIDMPSSYGRKGFDDPDMVESAFEPAETKVRGYDDPFRIIKKSAYYGRNYRVTSPSPQVPVSEDKKKQAQVSVNAGENDYAQLSKFAMFMEHEEIDREFEKFTEHSKSSLKDIANANGFNVSSSASKKHILDILHNHLYSIRKDFVQGFSARGESFEKYLELHPRIKSYYEEYLGISPSNVAEKSQEGITDSNEKRILDSIGDETKHLDDIADELGLSKTETSRILGILELQGQLIRTTGLRFRKRLPTDARFMTGNKNSALKPIPEKVIDAFIARAQKGFRVKINKARTVSDLPKRYQGSAELVEKNKGKIFGMYDPITGEVWIVYDGVTSFRRLQETILHEIVGHAGLRETVGNDYENFLLDIANNSKFTDDIYQYAVRNKMDIVAATDEWFAEKVESGKIDKSLWSRFVGMIRNFLKQLGFNLKFSDQDLKALIRESYNAVSSRDLMRTRSGEPRFDTEDEIDYDAIDFELMKNRRYDFRNFVEAVISKTDERGFLRQIPYLRSQIDAYKYDCFNVEDEITKRKNSELRQNIELIKDPNFPSWVSIVYEELKARSENLDVDMTVAECLGDKSQRTGIFTKEDLGKIRDVEKKMERLGDIEYLRDALEEYQNGNKKEAHNYLVGYHISLADVKRLYEKIIARDQKEPSSAPRFAIQKPSTTPDSNEDNAPFVMQDELWSQTIRRKIQDMFNRVYHMQQYTEEARQVSLPEKLNVYLNLRLLKSKTSDRINRFYDEFMVKNDSLLKRMVDSGIMVEDMEHYLIAKDREGYIERVKKNNPDYDPGTFAMDDTQAAEILDTAEKSGLPFESFANEFYSMARRNLKNRLNAGLIDQESYDRILSSDSYYVPFKGTLKSRTPRPAVLNVGKGISVTGKEFRRVMGRKSLPDNPVAQLLIDHVEGIIRSEKNGVAQSFLDFVREYGKDMILENGNPVFSVSKTRFMPVYNKDGDIIYMSPVITQDEKDGKVLSVKVNEAYKDPKTKVETKKNYTYKITIHDKALLEALKNMGAVRGIPVLRTYLNFLRSVTTMYNVDFLLPNFERDVETAFIHMSGKHGFKKASAIIKEVGSAIRGVWRSVREKTPTPYSDWYDRFKKVGGATGFYSIKNNEEICLEMERRVRHFNLTGKGWYRVLDSVRNVVKNANETVESATRLVYFKNLVEAGMSEKQAALAAKDLTVDFDLHGQWGTAINSMYLFANANLQGTWNAFSNIKNSKTVQGITAGIFFTSLLSSFFNRWVNPDEWEKMSQYNKDSNWAIMLPGGKMLVKRVAFVYNIPNTAGRVVDEYLHNEITLTEGMARMLEATTDAVNPLGSGSFFQVIAPTVLDPIVQVGENKNWNSVPIYKEQPMYSAKRPNSQMYFKSVSEPSRIATKFLNDITKQSGTGSRAAGAIDINPEIIDHFVETFAGGLGRTIENSVTTATTLGKGEIPEMNSIPIVRTIVKEGSAWVQVSRARDLLEESGRTKYGLAVKKRFHHLVNSARLSGLLNQKEADRMQREFDNNQKKIKQK